MVLFAYFYSLGPQVKMFLMFSTSALHCGVPGILCIPPFYQVHVLVHCQGFVFNEKSNVSFVNFLLTIDLYILSYALADILGRKISSIKMLYNI